MYHVSTFHGIISYPVNSWSNRVHCDPIQDKYIPVQYGFHCFNVTVTHTELHSDSSIIHQIEFKSTSKVHVDHSHTFQKLSTACTHKEYVTQSDNSEKFKDNHSVNHQSSLSSHHVHLANIQLYQLIHAHHTSDHSFHDKTTSSI